MDATISTPIQPNLIYTPRQIAEIVDKDTEWVMRNLIYPRTCRHKKIGAVYLIYGTWLIEWIISEHHQLGEDDPKNRELE